MTAQISPQKKMPAVKQKEMTKTKDTNAKVEKYHDDEKKRRIEYTREDSRIKAAKQYRERRIRSTHGNYDEVSEWKAANKLPRFAKDEIYCGPKLGNGAFGSVYDIHRFALEKKDNEDENQSSSRAFMAEHCYRDTEGDSDEFCFELRKESRYAIKMLRSRIVNGDHKTFYSAMVDMATETRLLSMIPQHPNIIKLRGIATGSDNNSSFPSCCFHEDYFLILDKLYGTLDDRLDEWKQASQYRKRLLSKLMSRQQHTEQDFMYERLVACRDLASALAHLHKHRIIHRDVKPVNIGFNIRGDVTLFDLGLSRELPPVSAGEDVNEDLFRMTGFCGSPRYMAPEVGMKKKYNAKCDVYSFGVLAWQILTLQKPYKGCDIPDLEDHVWPGTNGIIGPGDWRKPGLIRTPSAANVQAKGQKRPRKFLGSLRRTKSMDRDSLVVPDKNLPKPIANNPELAYMIDRTFSRNIKTRPTMKELTNFLRIQCRNHEDSVEDDEGSSHPMRRRSTHVFKRASIVEDMTHHGADICAASVSSHISLSDELTMNTLNISEASTIESEGYVSWGKIVSSENKAKGK